MTSATEAKLCREAEICYATMNLVSDYDVWHVEEKPVSVEIILENLRQNIHQAKAIIKKALSVLPEEREAQCDCGVAMENIVVTKPELIPEETKKRLRFIIEKYIKS
jgi:5'-methylthioadenosine phosphorylase